MDICSYYYYIFICVIFIQDSAAKTFSLNEAIAVENQQKQHSESTPTPKLPETTAERFSLNKSLRPKTLLTNKFKESDSLFLRNKKLSPFKYRKTFQIKTPLKPKKLKHSPKQKYKRRNQYIKREINGSDKLNQKYIPLLKSIGMLFDNLLDRDTSNSYEIPSSERKRNRLNSMLPEEKNRLVCKCADETDTRRAKPESPEKAIVIPDFRITVSNGTENIPTIETATTATNYTPVSDVSRLRQHKNLPLLLPGNPVSSWRNDNGISERSSTAYNWSTERDFTRDNGNSKHITGRGENGSHTQHNDEVTYSSPRDCASGNGSNTGEFGNGKDNTSTKVPSTTNESIDNEENENSTDDYRFSSKFKRENNLEARGNKTKSTKLLSELVRRLRGHVSENKVEYNTEPKQSKEVYTESVFNIAHNNASYKPITNRSRSITTQDQKIRSGNETITLINDDPLNQNSMVTRNLTNNAPVVMIIDGYSVTRNKHGENKYTKKSIHFHH